ncbi:transglutaminase family protein [Methanobrevibacter sp.]|uniref:transglutaminase-like domain-containing protein n=1 Tax=Methanobrevibacter sp. TaxID=66852 RepID=UPI0025DDB486|nr:transglutaminase-like domain-containing protein [Methanobrevibacter sp.]
MNAYRNPIANADIEFSYDGVSKHASTNAQGVATIDIGGLSKGDYLVVYKYAAGDNAGQSNIRVTQSVLNVKNTISNLSPYLSSSSNCPVSNAEIVALARQLTDGLTHPLDKAMALFSYVRDEIPYSYYYNTYYGALGTLHAKKGNCVDQSHLLVALYRASGLPARYVHGTCVFSDGDTDGHVWVQVLLGDTWLVSDPINKRNSVGEVVNWNNNNYRLKGYYSSMPF